MKNYLSIRDAFNEGFDHGRSLASWNASEIEFGKTLAREIDWIGVGKVDCVESWLAAFDCVIAAADENSRQYSPFEFIAVAINNRDSVFGEGEAESGWNAFERGLHKGAAAYRKKNYPIRELKRALREYEKGAD